MNMSKKKCEVPNCNETDISLNTELNQYLCSKHKTQYARYGKFFEYTRYDPNPIIPCNDYYEILFLDENGDVVEVGKLDEYGANKVKEEYKPNWRPKWNCNWKQNTFSVSNSTLSMTLAQYLTGHKCKFKNGDKLDFRLSNLIPCEENVSDIDESKLERKYEDKDIIEYDDYVELIIRSKKSGKETARIIVDKDDIDRVVKYFWEYTKSTKRIHNKEVGGLKGFILKLNKTGKNISFKNGNEFDFRKENLITSSSRSSKTKKEKHNIDDIRNRIALDDEYKYLVLDGENIIVVYEDRAEIILEDKNKNESGRAVIEIKDIEKCKPFRWGKNARGYVNATLNKNNREKYYSITNVQLADVKQISLSRFIAGCYDRLLVVDHTDTKKSNNRGYNLESKRQIENNRNLTGKPLAGIKKIENKNSVVFRVKIGRSMYLGTYKDEIEAIRVRLFFEKKLGYIGHEDLMEQYKIDDMELSQFNNYENLIIDIYKDRLESTIGYSRRKKLKADLSLNEYLQILELYTKNGELTCAYCGEKIYECDDQIDHFIPSIKDGGTTVGNVLPTCKVCNESKLYFDFEKWYDVKPFYSSERKKLILDYVENPSKYIKKNVIYIDLIMNRGKNKYFKYTDKNGEIQISCNRKQTAEELNILKYIIDVDLNINSNSSNNKKYEYATEDELKKYFEAKGFEVRKLPNRYKNMTF